MTDLATNVLYYGDNLDTLRRYLPDAAVDLVYLDPPATKAACARSCILPTDLRPDNEMHACPSGEEVVRKLLVRPQPVQRAKERCGR